MSSFLNSVNSAVIVVAIIIAATSAAVAQITMAFYSYTTTLMMVMIIMNLTAYLRLFPPRPRQVSPAGEISAPPPLLPN